MALLALTRFGAMRCGPYGSSNGIMAARSYSFRSVARPSPLRDLPGCWSELRTLLD
jgi:hypothetical protein